MNEKKEAALIQYESAGVAVKLSPTIIRKYLVSGKSELVSDQEIMLYLMLCRSKKMNPFVRDCYLIKYSDKEKASMVTGKDFFARVASGSSQYDGFKAGIIVEAVDATDSKPAYFEGAFAPMNTNIVGGWADVYRKDRKYPFHNEVDFDGYAGRKQDGNLNKMWSTKPGTMIRKVALIQSWREAFPELLGGLYDADEMQMLKTSDELPQNNVDMQDLSTGKPEVSEPVEKEPEAGIERTLTDDEVQKLQASIFAASKKAGVSLAVIHKTIKAAGLPEMFDKMTKAQETECLEILKNLKAVK